MVARENVMWWLRLGWLAVATSTILTSLWAFWGSIEAFHEGWYFRSFWQNVALTLGQSLMPMGVFLAAAMCGVRWPAIGGTLHVALGMGAAFFIGTPAGRTLIGLPLVVLGLAYAIGRIESRRRAAAVLLVVPFATALLSGAYPAYRVATRVTDVSNARVIVSGQGVRLWWAPRGPGWPEAGTSWFEATRACSHLSTDGATLAPGPLDIWRLPTAEEVVRSATFHHRNSGGRWDAGSVSAAYRERPDKEPPLWDPYSQVIYWWTATEVDPDRAVRYVYNGRTVPTLKRLRPAYFGFRCVTQPRE